MSEAVRQVEDEVRELIRRSGLDPTRHPLEVDRLVRDAVSDYDERSVHGGLPVLASLNDTVKSVLDVVAGYGPLQRYFDDPTLALGIWEPRSPAASPRLAHRLVQIGNSPRGCRSARSTSRSPSRLGLTAGAVRVPEIMPRASPGGDGVD